MPEEKLTIESAIEKLRDKAKSIKLPDGMVETLNELFAQLEVNSKSEDTFWQFYQSDNKYLDWVIKLPWNTQSQDILDLDHTRQKLDENHYGLDEVKQEFKNMCLF